MAHRAPIVLAPYDPSWPSKFDAERRTLLSLVAPWRFRIEHVGSTSVPGVGAKPIIDILLGCDRISEFEGCIPALQRAGWQYLPENEEELPERRFLAKPTTQPRSFHLQAVALRTRFWAQHLLFRDRLRESPEIASSYATLKVALARKLGDDREAYTRGKASFITSVLDGSTP